jgi:large subunit ribosomal protein L21
LNSQRSGVGRFCNPKSKSKIEGVAILPDCRTGFHPLTTTPPRRHGQKEPRGPDNFIRRPAAGAGAKLTLLQYDRYNFRLSSPAIFWRVLTVAYAIIQAGGKQFRVSKGEVIRIPSLTAEVGSSVNLDALLQGDGGSLEFGGSPVTATVVEHGRGPKIIVFKKKRRKQYKKTHGHRQNYTAVRIESIGSDSE